MNKVVTRYPIAIRLGVLLVCALLVVGIGSGSVSNRTIVVAAGALCLLVAVLAYRAEVDATEVRVRYLPFYTKRTPMSEVTHLVEEKTLILVTANSKIPLWGLPLKARGSLFEILPRHLEVVPTHSYRRSDSAAVVRRHMRRTVLVAVAFLVSLGLSVPFLKGNAWNEYVDSIGKYILFFCLCIFLLLLFQAGFTYVLWSSKRGFDKIQSTENHHRHG